jgi:hypothetical protein
MESGARDRNIGRIRHLTLQKPVCVLVEVAGMPAADLEIPVSTSRPVINANEPI